MIKNFRHKDLENFFRYNERKGVNTQHAAKLARILDRLDASQGPRDMDLPGYKLHRLKGKEEGEWTVWVSGNWRVTFRFEGKDAVAVNYLDYH